MSRAIPPVFNEVCPTRWSVVDAARYWEEHYPSYKPTFFRSGTEALACALNSALAGMDAEQRNVIIPAYGCPHLVAAALFADANPVLVDVLPDRWGYDLDKLEDTLKKGRAAVVAVDLFGLGDQFAEINFIATSHDCVVVQDAAQSVAESESDHYKAPHVIWSFGRGKPVNFLGGGALLARRETDLDLTHYSRVAPGRWRTALWRTGAFSFNHVMRSPLFGLLSKIPGAGIGSTVFSRCDEVVVLPDDFLGRLAPALEAKFSERSDVESTLIRLVRGLSESRGFEVLLARNDAETNHLLRLPLLASNREARDSVVTALNERGLGASAMYGTPLPQVERMPAIVSEQRGFAGAESFAGRLFTLPVHSMVTDSHIQAIEEVLCSALLST